MIIIEPLGGLCNRMRAISSAIGLSKRYERPLEIHWRLDSGLNCLLEELFEPIADVERVLTIREKLGPFPPAETGELLVRQKDHMRFFDPSFFPEIEASRKMHIRSCGFFYINPEGYSGFKVHSSLQPTIESLYRENQVGVHIRRTDNRKAIANSPDSVFLKLMEKELEEHPQSTFFLATDSQEIESKFADRFGDKLTFYRKRERSRNHPDGIKDAVIDLYGLAQCERIIGSFWSSFSEAAAEIGGIHLDVAKEGTL